MEKLKSIKLKIWETRSQVDLMKNLNMLLEFLSLNQIDRYVGMIKHLYSNVLEKKIIENPPSNHLNTVMYLHNC